MADDRVELRFLTGTVDFQELMRTTPPMVTVEGFPPKDGEGCGPYLDRLAKLLGVKSAGAPCNRSR